MSASRFDLRGRSLRALAARGTLINSAFAVAVGLLGLLRGFLLAALLTPEDYGVWGILLVSLGTLTWLKAVGISDRFVQQDEADQELEFQRAFTLEAILNTALGLLVVAAVPVMAILYDESKIIAPGLALVALLPAMTLQAPLWVLYRKMDFARQRALMALDPIVGLAVGVGMAAAGAGYWSFVGAALAGAYVTAIAALWTCPYPLRWRYDAARARSYISFSGPLLVSSVGGIVVAQGSILAGQAAAGLAAAGAITLASSVSFFTNRVDDVLTDTLYPAICAVADRTELLFESFVKSNRLALMWALPFGFGLALFAPDLQSFGLGDDWGDAVEPLQAFGVAAAIGHLGFNWTAYFMARADTKPIAVHSVSAAAAFLAIELPLILAYGLRGVAIGTVAVVAVSLLVRWLFLRRLFTDFRLGRHALRALWPAVPGVVLVLAARALETGERTALEATLELVLYGVVTVAVTVLSERRLLREAIGYLRPQAPPAGGPAAPPATSPPA
ncbi:oligosaccharide flippase family protein [Conexibacter sp. SYSU D00693]|uniref:oligosaccharide flippase family protein n=1 Tax=Conexibacter sp. SYSU D00693 TaxID=2812560 RepID=UPI00196B2B70|nr:oligosaccharide flippase family protein [Conexibacter sp. SYSU D00693]